MSSAGASFCWVGDGSAVGAAVSGEAGAVVAVVGVDVVGSSADGVVGSVVGAGSGGVGVGGLGSGWAAPAGFGMLRIHPGRINDGSVKVAPPGSVRPRFASQARRQFSPSPVTSSARSHNVSPGSTVTSSTEGTAEGPDAAPAGVRPVAFDGRTSTVPG